MGAASAEGEETCCSAAGTVAVAVAALVVGWEGALAGVEARQTRCFRHLAEAFLVRVGAEDRPVIRERRVWEEATIRAHPECPVA